MLITHFDLTPSGQEAWIADKDGGISHCDFRDDKRGGRRWVVQDQGRAAKLGGISVNRKSSLLHITLIALSVELIYPSRDSFDASSGTYCW
jgi:hypothetical protein